MWKLIVSGIARSPFAKSMLRNLAGAAFGAIGWALGGDLYQGVKKRLARSADELDAEADSLANESPVPK